MTNGTSQGLFVIISVVIFGIFVGMSYILFQSKLNVGLSSVFDNGLEQTLASIGDDKSCPIDINANDHSVYREEKLLSNVILNESTIDKSLSSIADPNDSYQDEYENIHKVKLTGSKDVWAVIGETKNEYYTYLDFESARLGSKLLTDKKREIAKDLAIRENIGTEKEIDRLYELLDRNEKYMFTTPIHIKKMLNSYIEQNQDLYDFINRVNYQFFGATTDFKTSFVSDLVNLDNKLEFKTKDGQTKVLKLKSEDISEASTYYKSIVSKVNGIRSTGMSQEFANELNKNMEDTYTYSDGRITKSYSNYHLLWLSDSTGNPIDNNNKINDNVTIPSTVNNNDLLYTDTLKTNLAVFNEINLGDNFEKFNAINFDISTIKPNKVNGSALSTLSFDYDSTSKTNSKDVLKFLKQSSCLNMELGEEPRIG